MASWLTGAGLMTAGALLIGFSLGFRAGARKSHLAKDLRISAQDQRIARLEKSLGGDPTASGASLLPDEGGEVRK